MTHISTVIMDLLKSDAGVKALVGTRIYPDCLPQDPDLPALAVIYVDGVPDKDIPSSTVVRVQVSCFSNPPETNGVKSPQEVEQVAQAVKDALHHSDLEKNPMEVTVGNVTHTITKAPQLIGERRFREDGTDYYHMPLDFSLTFMKKD